MRAALQKHQHGAVKEILEDRTPEAPGNLLLLQGRLENPVQEVLGILEGVLVARGQDARHQLVRHLGCDLFLLALAAEPHQKRPEHGGRGRVDVDRIAYLVLDPGVVPEPVHLPVGEVVQHGPVVAPAGRALVLAVDREVGEQLLQLFGVEPGQPQFGDLADRGHRGVAIACARLPEHPVHVDREHPGVHDRRALAVVLRLGESAGDPYAAAPTREDGSKALRHVADQSVVRANPVREPDQAPRTVVVGFGDRQPGGLLLHCVHPAFAPGERAQLDASVFDQLGTDHHVSAVGIKNRRVLHGDVSLRIRYFLRHHGPRSEQVGQGVRRGGIHVELGLFILHGSAPDGAPRIAAAVHIRHGVEIGRGPDLGLRIDFRRFVHREVGGACQLAGHRIDHAHQILVRAVAAVCHDHGRLVVIHAHGERRGNQQEGHQDHDDQDQGNPGRLSPPFLVGLHACDHGSLLLVPTPRPIRIPSCVALIRVTRLPSDR